MDPVSSSPVTDRPAFTLHRGSAPLLLSIPHSGTHVPPAIAARLSERGRQLPDTDWHLERLYGFARELGATLLVATHSRYVIDLNRPPDDASLYPGQNVTGLCPVDSFDELALYPAGDVPCADEVAGRRDAVWAPYHAQLRQELDRLRQAHGRVVLWEAHSIRSVLPRFFEGRLPDLNLGTADGKSCDPALARRLLAVAQAAPDYSSVLNGRFKGGYITRQYGEPARGIHAVQLELTQCSYMQEALPFDYLPREAARVQPVLRQLLQAALDFAGEGTQR
ncbi:N-formylglutamate deformylase [Pulveribacter suum]|uniref:N-formylglutamate deformylase n=1 Tax=Pulveribacter suum TaxID=2116657 RepID=A0A2P1NKL4_9BURK|nr:N-formylglutamate deformylase [Pulveribacter suum]AVP57604.1 N-formylglutamate deformylase [Pulveribacter suum]